MSGQSDKVFEKSKCFIIMPFTAKFDKLYNLIESAVISLDWICHRADNDNLPVPIIKDIWDGIQSSKCLVCVLTDHNPNVFYELGLAHACSKPVIMVISSDQKIPFDIGHIRSITYNKEDPEWGQTLKESIYSSLRSIQSADPTIFIPSFLLGTVPEEKPVVDKYDKEIRKIWDSLENIYMRLDTDPEPPQMGLQRGYNISAIENIIRQGFESNLSEQEIIKKLKKAGLYTPYARKLLIEYITKSL